MTIEHSAGLAVTVGNIPFIVGGGYRGVTDELTAAVDAAAIALHALFDDHPITIRFNSDRLSGGAWLKTAEVDGFGLNTEIEIGAHLINLAESRRIFDKYFTEGNSTFEDHIRGRLADPDGPNEQVIFCTYIKADYLRDPAMINDAGYEGNGVGAKACDLHKTLDEAVAFVREFAVADPRPITAALKKARAERHTAYLVATETTLVSLSRAQLLNVLLHVPYECHPHGTQQMTKPELREAIMTAARSGKYRFDPKHVIAY